MSGPPPLGREKAARSLPPPLPHYAAGLPGPNPAGVPRPRPTPTSIEGLRSQPHLAEPVLADIVSYLVASGIVLVGDWDIADGQPHFDEDDDFWARGLSNWAEESGLPALEDVRGLGGKVFVELAKKLTNEDPRRIRELVRQTATREDRRLGPPEGG